MPRLMRRPDSTDLNDCVAHRCDDHAGFDAVNREDFDGYAECAICVAQRLIAEFVKETIVPIGVAFAIADGQLRLLGVDRGQKTGPLFQLLTALTEKTAENDFKLVAQKVLGDGHIHEGPKEPQ